MKTKLQTFFVAVLFICGLKGHAADYYTASSTATLAGNTGAVNANWTTNPDGTTGLATVAIAASDNLIILNGDYGCLNNNYASSKATLL